jgi:hypothetical protein
VLHFVEPDLAFGLEELDDLVAAELLGIWTDPQVEPLGTSVRLVATLRHVYDEHAIDFVERHLKGRVAVTCRVQNP